MLFPHDVVCRDKKLVACQFRRTVEIDRIRRLIRRERDHLLHPAVDRRIDHELRTVNVSVDALHRIVFGDVHMLHRRCMDHIVNILHRFFKPLEVSHISDEIAHTSVGKLLCHIEMFLLVTGVDDDFIGLIAL